MPSGSLFKLIGTELPTQWKRAASLMWSEDPEDVKPWRPAAENHVNRTLSRLEQARVMIRWGIETGVVPAKTKTPPLPDFVALLNECTHVSADRSSNDRRLLTENSLDRVLREVERLEGLLTRMKGFTNAEGRVNGRWVVQSAETRRYPGLNPAARAVLASGIDSTGAVPTRTDIATIANTAGVLTYDGKPLVPTSKPVAVARIQLSEILALRR